MKKIILMMFVVILFTGLLSAFEFDNVKTYDEIERSITVHNVFNLPLIGNDIVKITPLTPHVVSTFAGPNQTVAIFHLENFKDGYSDVWKKMEFYNLNKNSKEENRQFFFQEKVIVGTREKPIYNITCETLSYGNGTTYQDCTRSIKGYETIDITEWEDLDTSEPLSKGNHTIRIVTDVFPRDHMEFIPTWFGVRMPEYAEWTAGLNEEIVFYYNFEQGAGSAIPDVTGNLPNATLFNMEDSDWTLGKIGNGLNFSGGDESANTTYRTSYSTSDNFSISFWYNTNESVQASREFFGTLGGDGSAIGLDYSPGLIARFRFRDGGTGDLNLAETSIFNDGDWHMHTIVRDTAADTYEIFFDGVSEASAADPAVVNINFNDAAFFLSARGTVGAPTTITRGEFDEFGWWNRSLNQSEITQLFNGGDGITFISDFPPVVNVTVPLNITFNTTQTQLNFTVVSAGGGFDRCFFSTDGGVTNSTDNDCTSNFTTTSVEGANTWTVFSNTTGGAVGQDSVTFTVNSTIQVDLFTPANDSNFLSPNIDFNCQATDSLSLENLTLLIDGIENFTNSSTGSTLINLTTTVIGVSLGQHTWTCRAFDSDNFNASAAERIFEIKKFDENSQTFNAFTFETKDEEFTLNITTDPSSTPSAANLIYNGTDKGGGTITSLGNNNFNISQTIDIPTGSGNNTWLFNITIEGILGSSQTNQQSVALINLTFCQAAPQDVAYINFSFINETINQEDVTAFIDTSWSYFIGAGSVKKDLIFANTTEAFSYSFCFNPPNQTITGEVNLTYNNAQSQQRIFSSIFTVLTNLTTQQNLFLLPTQLGLFAQFRTQDTLGNTLVNVLASITRTLGGITISVTSDTTDGSGVVVFFLNPDVTYTGEFSLIGFVTNTFSFVPVTDLRTVVLGSTATIVVNGTTIGLGTEFEIQPNNDSLNNNTLTTFSFNVTGGTGITLISMNITNGTNQLSFVSNAGVGFISGIVDTGNNTQLFGEFIIQTANETITVQRIWIIGPTFIGDYSLFRQLTLFNEYGFKDIFRFLIVLGIIVALLIFLSGENQLEDEIKMLVMLLLIWGFSIVGWLDTGIVVSSTSDKINNLTQFSSQFGIAILTTVAASYFILRRVLRII
ncbi:hypothetical protein LCGC14_0466040 [marine sediment metagenome]|uniref:Laminin G domain-containing protein n=1 Tax=marine sediment metagenome TaxID=412755 RepID=A0A0F9SDW0_9ZZZZ